ncbi:hypothetical protein ACFS6H_15755 [Terrimonas rubra]|uniref:Uncharacterized protein n=1 Tax=Terrimonas rubra TaxID=1035890 RepID=A0ABW6A960_9BACT
MAISLFLSLIISAFLGWLAAWLCSRYLVNSIVRHKHSLATHIGHFAAEHISLDSFRDKLSDAGLLETAMPAIEKHIDEFLNVKLKEEIPMIGMFIGNKTTDQLKAVFIKQLQTLFPEIMQQLSGNLAASFNMEQLVSEKINALPDARLKEQLQTPLQKPLAGLQVAGLITGAIIGAVNALIFYLG